MLGPLLEVDMSKKWAPLWREAHLEAGALLEVAAASKKWTPFWREAHFQVKMLKTTHARTTLEGSDAFLRGRRKGFCTCQREGLVAFPKTTAGLGHLKRIWTDACRVAGAIQDMFIRDVRRSGRWFPERGCILEQQIVMFAKVGRRSTWHGWSGKIAKRIGTVCGSQLFEGGLAELLRFWFCQFGHLRTPRRIASFFDVVNFKNWCSLVKFLCFWCCQIQTLRKSRRIAPFSSLQVDR